METIKRNIITMLCILSYWGVYLLGLYGDFDLLIVCIIITAIAVIEILVLQLL